MKRYNCTSSDKRGAFGLCMEEHKEGAFVPFSEVSGLAEQLADATRQSGVMAELLRKARTNVDQVRRWGRFDHDEGCGAEAALLLARIDVALAGKETSRIITEGQEIELVTVLQSIVSGFSDDPAHDAAALLMRITGEVPWTGDSFQLPSRQGGEQLNKNPAATAGQSAPALNKQPSLTGQVLAGMGAATLLAGLDKESASDVVQLMLEAAEAKGGGSCATEPPSSSQA